MMENDLQNMENAGVLRRCIGAMRKRLKGAGVRGSWSRNIADPCMTYAETKRPGAWPGLVLFEDSERIDALAVLALLTPADDAARREAELLAAVLLGEQPSELGVGSGC